MGFATVVVIELFAHARSVHEFIMTALCRYYITCLRKVVFSLFTWEKKLSDMRAREFRGRFFRGNLVQV